MLEDKETGDEAVETTQAEGINTKSTVDPSQRFLIGTYTFLKDYLTFLSFLLRGNITQALSTWSKSLFKEYTILDVTSEVLKWADPGAPSSFANWLGLIFFFGVLVPFLVGFTELTSYLWRPITVYLYTAFFVEDSFILFAFLILEKNKEARKTLKTSSFLTLMLLLTIALVVCFSQANRHLYFLLGGFTVTRVGFWDWLWFGFAQVADNASFDFFTIFSWHISSIQATSLWSRTIIFLFNLELELIVIVVIVRQLQLMQPFRLTRKRKGE